MKREPLCMLQQFSDQSKDQKLEKLSEFLLDLDQHLKSAKEFKSKNPERADLNALIELNLAIQEETRAVSNLVEIEEDCPEDWQDLDEAEGSHSRTLARIDHSNWVAQGPSSSRRFNQLFFHFGGQGDHAKGDVIISELVEVSERLLTQELTPALKSQIHQLVKFLRGNTGKGFLLNLNDQLQQLEDFLELSLFDQILDEGESWLSKFLQLTEAVASGDAQKRSLLEERDIALNRLQELPSTPEEFTAHFSSLEKALTDDSSWNDWRQNLASLWSELEASQQSALTGAVTKCAVCTGEVGAGLGECPSCGAAVLSLKKTKVAGSQQKRGSSQLLDSLWDSWNQFQCGELNQEQLSQALGAISNPILKVVAKIDSPSPLLLDFSARLETFIQLSDRDSLEENWPSLIASGRALIEERISLLKRE